MSVKGPDAGAVRRDQREGVRPSSRPSGPLRRFTGIPPSTRWWRSCSSSRSSDGLSRGMHAARHSGRGDSSRHPMADGQRGHARGQQAHRAPQSSIIGMLDKRELDAVLAHEAGHVLSEQPRCRAGLSRPARRLRCPHESRGSGPDGLNLDAFIQQADEHVRWDDLFDRCQRLA